MDLTMNKILLFLDQFVMYFSRNESNWLSGDSKDTSRNYSALTHASDKESFLLLFRFYNCEGCFNWSTNVNRSFKLQGLTYIYRWWYRSAEQGGEKRTQKHTMNDCATKYGFFCIFWVNVDGIVIATDFRKLFDGGSIEGMFNFNFRTDDRPRKKHTAFQFKVMMSLERIKCSKGHFACFLAIVMMDPESSITKTLSMDLFRNIFKTFSIGFLDSVSIHKTWPYLKKNQVIYNTTLSIIVSNLIVFVGGTLIYSRGTGLLFRSFIQIF